VTLAIPGEPRDRRYRGTEAEVLRSRYCGRRQRMCRDTVELSRPQMWQLETMLDVRI